MVTYLNPAGDEIDFAEFATYLARPVENITLEGDRVIRENYDEPLGAPPPRPFTLAA